MENDNRYRYQYLLTPLTRAGAKHLSQAGVFPLTKSLHAAKSAIRIWAIEGYEYRLLWICRFRLVDLSGKPACFSFLLLGCSPLSLFLSYPLFFFFFSSSFLSYNWHIYSTIVQRRKLHPYTQSQFSLTFSEPWQKNGRLTLWYSLSIETYICNEIPHAKLDQPVLVPISLYYTVK